MSARGAAGLLLGVLAVAGCSSGGNSAERAVAPTAATTTTIAVTTTTSTVAPTTAPSTTRPGAQPCSSSALALSPGENRVALGHALYLFALRNTSAQTCRLEGTPGVALLDGGGRLLGRAEAGAGHILPARPPRPVSLAPGATSWFGVEATTLCEGDADPTPSARISVTPPGDTGTVTAAVTIDVCPNGGLLVSPVRATDKEVAG